VKFQNKSAFTLLEIIIVLVIMGFVYSLSVTSFSKKTVAEEDSYFDLKSMLLDSVKSKYSTIELIVLEDDSYVLMVDGQEQKKTNFKLPKDIEFYTYEQDGKLKEIFKPFYMDEYFKTVKFRFKIYKNGSSTKSIVKAKDKYYIQSSYFKDRMVFDELYEAEAYLQLESLKQSMVPISE
jgi:prepilin-type N-terminal cleavage/methylation domain-containing protein